MSEDQFNLPLESAPGIDSPVSAPVASPGIRDEIAAAWGLPLGERVEISFRGGQLDRITGTLELAAAPAFPWNPREPLHLRIAGYTFTSREIARWTRL